MATTDGWGVALAGILGVAVLAALLLVPGVRLGGEQPWLVRWSSSRRLTPPTDALPGALASVREPVSPWPQAA